MRPLPRVQTPEGRVVEPGPEGVRDCGVLADLEELWDASTPAVRVPHREADLRRVFEYSRRRAADADDAQAWLAAMTPLEVRDLVDCAEYLRADALHLEACRVLGLALRSSRAWTTTLNGDLETTMFGTMVGTTMVGTTVDRSRSRCRCCSRCRPARGA